MVFNLAGGGWNKTILVQKYQKKSEDSHFFGFMGF
jgi:hypothetical protein